MKEPISFDSILGAVFLAPLFWSLIVIGFTIYYLVNHLKYYKTKWQIAIHIAVAFFKISVIAMGFVFSVNICDAFFNGPVLLKSIIVILTCASTVLALTAYGVYEDNVHETIWLFDYVDKITTDEKKELLRYMEYLIANKNKK